MGFCASAARAQTSLTEASGKVFYLKSGASTWGQVARGQLLTPGDQVRTSAGSRATIAFEDGSKVELGPNGSFILQEATSQGSSLKLGLGSLKAWVRKALSKRFEIRTPTAVCSVRGTEFQVDVNQSGNTAVQMFTGLLAVADQKGNEVLLKDNQSVSVTDRGLGPVTGAGGEQGGTERARESLKREVALDMSKEEVQAAAAIEARNAVYQQGKAIIDVNGNRVRIEEYIVRSKPDQFKLVVLNERADRFDYFYYLGTFNTSLPDDISVALRQLPGCIGAPCAYNLLSYETARSNTRDNMLEVATGGHQIDVNNNGAGYDSNGNPNDAVLAAYDPATDRFVSLNVPNASLTAGNDPFNTNRLTFNGVEHSRWAPSAAGLAAPGGNVQNTTTHVTYTNTTTVQFPPSCAPPNCTYTEDGVLHQVVYAENPGGTIWERYDSYIISDQGRIAKTADFAGITSGTQYKQTLLNWNFQTIVTASEFGGRKIDLAVEPKIFIQSGLIP